MAHVDVSRSAPVVERAEAVIGAPAGIVWDVLSEFSEWPSWNAGVTRMDFEGPLAVGTKFSWVGGGAKISSRLEEVVLGERLVWSGRTMGIRAIHVWSLEDTGESTRVHTEESFEGLLATILRPLMRKTLARALREGLESLKAEAESRAGAAATT